MGEVLAAAAPGFAHLTLSHTQTETHTERLETHLRRHLPALLTSRVDKRAEGKEEQLYLPCTTSRPDSLDLFSFPICHMPRLERSHSEPAETV